MSLFFHGPSPAIAVCLSDFDGGCPTETIALLDTGASVTCVDLGDLELLGLECSDPQSKIALPGGGVIECCEFPVQLVIHAAKDTSITMPVKGIRDLKSEGTPSIIIGMDVLSLGTLMLGPGRVGQLTFTASAFSL